MAKIILKSDYSYKYKRFGKLVYVIRPSKTIVPDHSGL